MMQSQVSVLAIFSLLAVSIAAGSPPDHNDNNTKLDRVMTFECLLNQVELSLTVPTLPAAGVPIPIRLVFHNGGDKSLIYLNDIDFIIEVTDSKGNKLKRLDGWNGTVDGHFGVLAPGESLAKTYELRQLFKIPEQGVFYMNVYRSFSEFIDIYPPELYLSHVKITIRSANDVAPKQERR